MGQKAALNYNISLLTPVCPNSGTQLPSAPNLRTPVPLIPTTFCLQWETGNRTQLQGTLCLQTLMHLLSRGCCSSGAGAWGCGASLSQGSLMCTASVTAQCREAMEPLGFAL